MFAGQFLKRLSDHRRNDSLATKLRKKRFALFENLYDQLGDQNVKILDVGGTEAFWESMGFLRRERVDITIVNLRTPKVSHLGVTGIQGDARNLSQFQNAEFDIVFSNSVIEHVGSFEDQKQMAAEIQRVASRYFIQTPNRYFPLEPHFLFPFFQFLPVPVGAWLLAHFDLGWYKEGVVDYDSAKERVQSIRLLNAREMKSLFPDSTLIYERYFGLKKSLIVYAGW